MRFAMKTATLPSLRVAPELRAAAESVLEEGESLSAFVENSVKAQIHYRKTQAEFIARGLAAREEAKRTGIYYTTEDVLAMMREKSEKAKEKAATAGLATSCYAPRHSLSTFRVTTTIRPQRTRPLRNSLMTRFQMTSQ